VHQSPPPGSLCVSRLFPYLTTCRSGCQTSNASKENARCQQAYYVPVGKPQPIFQNYLAKCGLLSGQQRRIRGALWSRQRTQSMWLPVRIPDQCGVFIPREITCRSGNQDRRWEVAPSIGAVIECNITIPCRNGMARVLRMLPNRTAAVERLGTLVTTEVVTYMYLRFVCREVSALHHSLADVTTDVNTALGPRRRSFA